MLRLFLRAGFFLATASVSTAQTVHLTPPEGYPVGVVVSVLDSENDPTPTVLKPASDGSWTFEVNRGPTVWRAEPVVLITLPERTIQADKVRNDELVVQLDLSFVASQVGKTFDFQLVYFGATNLSQRDFVASMRRHESISKILLSQELALHYIKALPPATGSEARRMTQTWFDATYRVISNGDWPLRISTFLEDNLVMVFEGDAEKLAYFDLMKAQLHQRLWKDKDELDDLLSGETPRCDAARSLVTFLTRLHEEEPELAEREGVGDPDDVLAKMSGNVELVCGDH